jgi:predicted ArsR family transcriptional regulator
VAERVELRHNSVVKLTGGHVAGDDSRTRDLVARSILENGPSTAAVLGERLGLTPAGIRRHLDLLVASRLFNPRSRSTFKGFCNVR